MSADRAAAAPAVSVVIPHFQDQSGLDAVLAGLAAQTLPEPVEIIVADDGSAVAPRVPAGVQVVRQEDRGFRAAAARNLGAAAARGEILAFLDGDTVPEPGYLAAVVETLRDSPHALVVGTRTHLDDALEPPVDRGEPAWLRDAWEATDHLRTHDDASFRYVISAVLSCRRETFERIGGFDARMTGYGGEDWELGWQAVLAGCDLLHVPEARAVHRGADWGGRSQADQETARAQKNAETLRLAPRITHPIARPQGLVHQVPDIAVTWDPGQAPAGAVVPVVLGLLGSGDVHVTLAPSADRAAAEPELRAALGADPRIRWSRAEGSAAGARVRPRFAVELLEPCLLPAGELQRACEEVARAGGAGLITRPERSDGPDGPAGPNGPEGAQAPGPVVVARILPERTRARSVRLGPPPQLRLERDWPLLEAPQRLEDSFRTAGEARLRP